MKKVENMVTKVNIANFEQILQWSQCFQKSSPSEASERVYMCESVKSHLLLRLDKLFVIGKWLN